MYAIDEQELSYKQIKKKARSITDSAKHLQLIWY